MKKLQELKPQQIKKVFGISAIVIVLIAAISAVCNILWLAVISFILMIAVLAFNIIFYRCPYCGKHLGRDGGDYCQYCGASFDGDSK